MWGLGVKVWGLGFGVYGAGREGGSEGVLCHGWRAYDDRTLGGPS